MKDLWSQLACVLVQRFGGGGQRAADYLRKLCRDQCARDALPPLPWHEHAHAPLGLQEAIAQLGNPVIVRDMWPAAQFIAHVRR